jgi:hypothetical protein
MFYYQIFCVARCQITSIRFTFIPVNKKSLQTHSDFFVQEFPYRENGLLLTSDLKNNNMNKSTLLSFFFLAFLSSSALNAQVCVPDSLYRDSTGGVFPRPVSEEYPDAGIDVPACIGDSYFFNFTVVVPDTVVFNGIPLVMRRIRLRANNPVQGLPVGLSHACEPSNCDMAAGTLGCIALSGVVDATNEAKDYPLIIYVDLVTSFAVIPTQFPNPALAPGEYFITVKESNDPECLASIRTTLAPQPIKIAPNPGSGNLMVYLPQGFSGQGTLQLTDQAGRVVYFRRTDRLEGIWDLDLADLPKGFYTLQLIGDKQFYQAKYIRQ